MYTRRVFSWFLTLAATASLAVAQNDRPNILLFLADDLGYSDLGSFGGEIDTPHLNRLAAGGLRLTDVYSAGRCCPSRASLLTGLYPHQAGLGWMTAADLGRPAYQGELSQASVTLAEVLKEAGYGTYAAGKWHLTRHDHEAATTEHPSWPRQRGFDRFFGSLRGGSYFAPPRLMQDNTVVSAPKEGFFLTDAIAQAASGYVQDHLAQSPGKPFFCYVPFTAPHWPLHAEEEAIAKYRQHYARGWDVLREERFARMRQMRLLEPHWTLPPRPAEVPAWDTLTDAQRKAMTERMAIYAAQVEGMDRGIGQMLAVLEKHRQLDNTLILFLSDNGASPEGGPLGFERSPGGRLGSQSSFASYGAGWASLSNIPFRGGKASPYEGGIASPCIVHWPRQIIARGRARTDPAHFIDIMPTLVEIAQARYPQKRGDHLIPPMEGRSLRQLFRGMSGSSQPVHYWEHEGHRAIRQGHWKLVSRFQKPWELYHLTHDRSESQDLASRYPAVVQDLSSRWDALASRHGVLPLDGRAWGERVPPSLTQTAGSEAAAALSWGMVSDPNAPQLPGEPGPASAALLPDAPRQPNIVLIFCDDLGYGDLGCYGSENHRTPHLDALAADGALLTNFYSASGVCTPSRAALLTGCYPPRVSMHMNHLPPGTSTMRQVLFPVARKGLHPNEITLAEALKENGYATACVGKWHLGDQKVFLPTRQGFDHYFGIPYSNDMGSKQFPVNPPLPLLRNEEVIEAPVDQSTLTKRYTEEAIAFIRSHQESPFFLYLPHTMPHKPIHVSEAFKEHSEHGIYASCVEEIDWSTGQILEALHETGLSEQTLVIFTSDNGAAKAWGGSNAPLAGFKGSVMEGGMRVPCVMRWPGHIPPRLQVDDVSGTIDLFPTLVTLAGGTLPADRALDGRNLWPLLNGQEHSAEARPYYFYQQDQLQAVRLGKWKLHLPLTKVRHPFRGIATKTSKAAKLYDLDTDIAEKQNVADQHPDIVAELTALADAARADLGDLDTIGKGTRPAGLVDRPLPLVKPSE